MATVATMEDKPSRGAGAGGSKRRCRYGLECRNIGKGCKFLHPGEIHTNDAKKKNAGPKRDKSKIQCRYAMECRNTKCPFFHHPAAVPVVCPKSPARVSPDIAADAMNGISSPKSPPNFMSQHRPSEKATAEQSKPPPHSNGVRTPSRKATTKKKCRWGAGCRNKKCSFIHPGQQFERETKQKPAAAEGEGGSLRSYSTALSPKTAPPSHGAKVAASSRPVAHSILPPSPTSYSTGLLFPPSQVDAGAPASEEISRFSNMFNAAAAGFSGDQERTPLYGKTSAFQNNHSDNKPDGGPVAGDQAVVQSQPLDADWLYEVLGLNGIVNDAEESQQQQSVVDDVIEQQDASANTMGGNIDHSVAKVEFNRTTPDEQIPTQKSETPVEVNLPKKAESESPSKKLIPEDEVVQSRRAALELRLESQQNPNNTELLSSLLLTCRSKQALIKTALERSMSNEAGDETEFDETNLMALFELNDLLVGSISVAESSLHTANKNGKQKGGGGTKKATAARSGLQTNAKGSRTAEKSSWKQVEKKAATTAANKPAPNKGVPPASSGKSNKKKTVNFTEDETQKQKETKPPVEALQSKPLHENRKPDPEQVAIDAARQEKERMALWMEEARKQTAEARERKKSKKNKKHDRWLKQNEEAREKRAKSWAERIAKENDYIGLIQKLLVAEFLRQMKGEAMGLTTERVISDAQASEIITKECRDAYHGIFEGPKRRVVVAGSDNKDMNGRQGTVRYWDREKEKFCVGLDTKKLGPDSDVQFVIPEILDSLTSHRPSKGDKKPSATSYDVDAPDFLNYGGVSLGFSFTLKKSHVVTLGSAASTKVGLETFSKTRDEEERQKKIQEEAERRREEEDQKRRAARRAQENAAWKQRKEEKLRKEREEYDQMKREWERRGGYSGFGRSMFEEDDEEDDEDCQCPRCRFNNNFSFGGDSFFTFNIGGMPFRVRFGGSDGSDEDSFFDEEFDDRWEGQLAEERDEENRKQAEIIGVDPDADARTIKLAYRKMALQFHPDKWKSDSDHGMSRADAENRFKAIQSAYDHLLSNFDD